MFKEPRGSILGKTVMTPEEIDAFLKANHIASMAFTNINGYPGLTPLNYAWDGVSFYIHVPPRGERFDSLAIDPKVTLNVYYDSNNDADENGMARHLSVTAYGEIREINGDEALAALDLMAYQADKPFKAGFDRNRPTLAALKIYAITPVHMTGRKILWRSQPAPKKAP